MLPRPDYTSDSPPTKQNEIWLLYLEDNVFDAEITQRVLSEIAPYIHLTVVKTVDGLFQHLQQEAYDVLMLDYRLGTGINGVDVLAQVRMSLIPMAVVVVTGQGDEQIAVTALRAGADDYVVKNDNYLYQLPDLLSAAIERFRTINQYTRRQLTVLYVEPYQDDMHAAVKAVSLSAPHIHLDPAYSAHEAMQRLTEIEYDAMVLEYSLPDSGGLEMLRHAIMQYQIPAIVLARHGSEIDAVLSIRLGALDYIVKRSGYLERLPTAVENAVVHSHLIKQRARLEQSEEALQRRLFEMSTLNRIMQAATSTLNYEKVLNVIAREVALALRVDQTSITLLNAERTTLTVVAEYIAPGCTTGLGDVIHLVPGTVTWEYIQNAAPAVVEDTETDPRVDVSRHILRRRSIKSMLLVPLIINQQVIGSIGLDEVRQIRQFTLDEINLAQMIGAQVAVVIENARLYRQLEETLERERRTHNQVLQLEKLSAMGKVAASLFHEINSPLSAILLNLDLATRTIPMNADQKRSMEAVYRSVNRVSGLVKQLKTLSQPPQIERIPMNVNDCLRSFLLLMTPQAESLDIVLDADLLDDHTMPMIVASCAELDQVFLNLFNNACEAFDQHTGVINISTGISERGEVIVQFSDNGPGVPEEVKERIWEPFFTTKSQGNGLGLPLVYRLVQSYGGSIQVESESGQGSTFTVSLPTLKS